MERMICTDNFHGLRKLVKGIYPMAMHRLCVVHLLRRAKSHLSREDYKRFKEEMKRIEESEGFEEAYTRMKKLIGWLEEEAPGFGKEVEKVAEGYVEYTRFPKELRSRLKSTNVPENLHQEMEKIRKLRGECMRFYNRRKELEFFEKVKKIDKKYFVAVYGRRRIGKTMLIKKTFEDTETFYYFVELTHSQSPKGDEILAGSRPASTGSSRGHAGVG